MSEAVIKIRRTIVVTSSIPLSSYPDMGATEACSWEMDKTIESVIEEIACVDSPDLVITSKVWVRFE